MRFRVLPGLPVYGPPAEQFSETGQGTHREGFVVEFLPPDAAAWTGNFQRGLSRFDAVVELPGSVDVIVIAGGEAYVVSPSSRMCVRTFGGQLNAALRIGDSVLLSNGLWLEAVDAGGVRWRTRRVSWDGFKNLRIEAKRALGEAWNPMENTWTPFAVDLENGDTEGGSYPLELPG